MDEITRASHALLAALAEREPERRADAEERRRRQERGEPDVLLSRLATMPEERRAAPDVMRRVQAAARIEQPQPQQPTAPYEAMIIGTGRAMAMMRQEFNAELDALRAELAELRKQPSLA